MLAALLTLLVTAAPAAKPTAADEPTADDAPVWATATAELTAGRTLAFSGFADLTLFDRLTVVLGYQFSRPQALQSIGGQPPYQPSLTHGVHLGVDGIFGEHWLVSALGTYSPRVRDAVELNPRAPASLRATLESAREAGLVTLSALYVSTPARTFEWSVDAGVQVGLYRLGKSFTVARFENADRDTLVWGRPNLGFTATFAQDTDVSVRLGYSAYSTDPLSAGRYDEADIARLEQSLRASSLAVARALASANLAAQLTGGRILQFDAVSGFLQAPLWFDARLQAVHRFGRVVSAQLAWSYLRYVPSAGYSNVFSARVAVRVERHLRLWLAGAAQLDVPVDQPALLPPEEPGVAVGGLLTFGVEVSIP